MKLYSSHLIFSEESEYGFRIDMQAPAKNKKVLHVSQK